MEEETMSRIRVSFIIIPIFALIVGCVENYGNVKTQSEDDSRVTEKELIDNWSNYYIWLNYSKKPGIRLIVFDPKKDDRKIVVDTQWSMVNDQETWTKILNANSKNGKTFDLGGTTRYKHGTTRVKEIWGPDSHLYGYIMHEKGIVEWVDAKLIEENTLKLSWQRYRPVGSPAR